MTGQQTGNKTDESQLSRDSLYFNMTKDECFIHKRNRFLQKQKLDVTEEFVEKRTKRQNHVALSSAEAKFVAISFACREVTNFSETCKRITNIEIQVTVFEENKSALELTKTKESKISKHIVNLCHNYVRSEVRDGRITLTKIPASEKIGDFFKKSLSCTMFVFF